MLPGPLHRGVTTIRALFACPLTWELGREQGVDGLHFACATYEVVRVKCDL